MQRIQVSVSMARENKTQAIRLLSPAAAALRQGGLVAFPTETVYGLGANANLEEAILRIFQAKGRPADNPLIVHLPNVEAISSAVDIARIRPHEKRLIESFWPGPLTLLLPPAKTIARSVYPGQTLIGVRVPNHPVAQLLLSLSGVPVAAPSANRSGLPSPTTSETVLLDLADHLDVLVEGGSCEWGIESTVAAVQEESIHIYRPGAITAAMLEDATGLPVTVSTGFQEGGTPLAPGMKYRHYAPHTPVSAWWGNVESVQSAMQQALLQSSIQRFGLIAPRNFQTLADLLQPSPVWTCWIEGEEGSYAPSFAAKLYSSMREADTAHLEALYVFAPSAFHPLGTAIHNRLLKATEGRLWHAESS